MRVLRKAGQLGDENSSVGGKEIWGIRRLEIWEMRTLGEGEDLGGGDIRARRERVGG